MVIPSLMVVVPTCVPTTAGRRNSRATMAQWLRMPPESATTAFTVANSGTHVGTVISHTIMSPCWSLLASSERAHHLRRALRRARRRRDTADDAGSVLGSSGRNPSILSTRAMKNGSGSAGRRRAEMIGRHNPRRGSSIAARRSRTWDASRHLHRSASRSSSLYSRNTSVRSIQQCLRHQALRRRRGRTGAAWRAHLVDPEAVILGDSQVVLGCLHQHVELLQLLGVARQSANARTSSLRRSLARSGDSSGLCSSPSRT